MSRIPPTSNAATGVPQVMDSITILGRLSSREGATKTSLPGNRSLLADTGLIPGARPTDTRRVQSHYPAAARHSPQTGNPGVISPGTAIAGDDPASNTNPLLRLAPFAIFPSKHATCGFDSSTLQQWRQRLSLTTSSSPTPGSSDAHTRTLQTSIYPARPAG